MLGDSQERIRCISLAKRIVNQAKAGAAAHIQMELVEALCVFSAKGASERNEINIMEILDTQFPELNRCDFFFNS